MKSRRWKINGLALDDLDMVCTNTQAIIKIPPNSNLSTSNFTWKIGKNF